MESGRDLNIPPSTKCFATWVLLATPQRKESGLVISLLTMGENRVAELL